MNIEQLHRHISENTGNESNICQIYAIKVTGKYNTSTIENFQML